MPSGKIQVNSKHGWHYIDNRDNRPNQVASEQVNKETALGHLAGL